MNKSHEDELYYYSSCFKVPYKTLETLYYKKQSQYIRRDQSLGKAVDLIHGLKQGERALYVIEEKLAQQERQMNKEVK